MDSFILRWKQEIENELNSILDWWTRSMTDLENGGFYGRIDGKNQLHPKADKGIILNTRLLWTYSTTAKHTKKTKYKELADRAFEYLKEYFLDPIHGGFYWQVDFQGSPRNSYKQI